jgi:hypothetical protein
LVGDKRDAGGAVANVAPSGRTASPGTALMVALGLVEDTQAGLCVLIGTETNENGPRGALLHL